MKFILSSIRYKVTLALLFAGLFSIATVGLLSRSIMLDRFNDLVVAEASKGFVDEATSYYRAYGSWQRARSTESFFDFVRRTRPQKFEANNRRPAQQRQENASRAETGETPPRSLGFGGGPPPFIVTDELGRVELALFEGYEVGELVSQELVDRAVPITLGEEVIGLAVPEQRFEISALEARYLSVFETSLVLSLILAGIVALVLGWYFGRRLTTPILNLRWSMEAVSKGDLKQNVQVKTDDELGRLTELFNEMCVKLDKSYQELEASNRLLSQYTNWLAAENQKAVLKNSSIDKDDEEGL